MMPSAWPQEAGEVEGQETPCDHDMLEQAEEPCPLCKQLVDAFRLQPNSHTKTPLAILHEYATRSSFEVSYPSFPNCFRLVHWVIFLRSD